MHGVRVLADDPAKIEQPDGDRSKLLMPQLLPEFDGVREQLTLISPYFVPGRDGVALLRRIRERGVRVRVLTNSLASTDVLPVFATYQKYRHELLAAGIELYEINPSTVAGQHARASSRPPNTMPRTAAPAPTPRCTARCWCSTAARSSSAR